MGSDFFLFWGLVFSLSAFSVVWLISLAKQDASIIDRYWGIGFVFLGFFYLLGFHRQEPRAILVLSLVSIWGLRLSYHIHQRNRGKPEDYRYERMRRKYGKSFPLISLFIVFWLQGFLIWLISLPLYLVCTSPGPGHLALDALGVLLWSIGFFFEAVGDYQLRRFKSDPVNRGKIMSTGLWRLTRHPNYFGDSCLWWGLFLIGLSPSWPLGLLSVISPVTMTFFLVKVSGVAMLEKDMAGRPGFAEYSKQTPAFFPDLSKLWK